MVAALVVMEEEEENLALAGIGVDICVHALGLPARCKRSGCFEEGRGWFWGAPAIVQATGL